MNFKDRIYDAVSEYMDKMTELIAQERELKDKQQKETIARVEADRLRSEMEWQRKTEYEEVICRIEKIKQAHSAAVEEWNMLDSAKLHPDAELLKLDIPMNKAQYQQLCDKHKDNSLMLSLLCKYADKHPNEELYAERPCDAATRISVFNDYAARAVNACREPDSMRAAMFLDNIGVPAVCCYEYGDNG